jgi:hypothetical protein
MALQFLFIAKEETRESATFGTLPTADLIKEVNVGEKGLLRIGYSARFKSSVSGAGKAAIFIGSNQLKIYTTEPKVQAATTVGTTFRQLSSSTFTGLATSTAGEAVGADVTTGQLISASIEGGMAELFIAAGTYDVSIQYKATSGSVTSKDRRLWVETPE